MSREMDINYKEHDFQFTKNWFRNRDLPSFRNFVHPVWAGKPITYLELGVFEGMSLVWMLQKILTHKDSKAVACDPWLLVHKIDSVDMENVMKRAYHNTEPYRDKCKLIRGNSAQVLRRMVCKNGFEGVGKNSVDLCMIDGSHNELAVLDDSRLCLNLVKPGGWLLFDDVENSREKKSDHVKHGLAAFVDESKDKIKFVWKDRFMEAYEKI